MTALRKHGGVASYRELLGLVDRQELERALTATEVVRIRRGFYGLEDGEDALTKAAELGGRASHLSAALVHGWKVKRTPEKPTITVDRHRSQVPSDGVDLHWGAVRGKALVTDPLQTVIDCARTLPFDEALAVADSALRSRKVTNDQLMAAAASSPRTGRARAIEVAQYASRKAANPFESVLRAIALGVPGLSVEPQGEIDYWTHPDLVDRRLKLALEADSYSYHSLQEAFEYDVRRYTGLTRAGWLVARFTWDEVMHKPTYVRAVLLDLVALRAQERAVQCLVTGVSACPVA